MSGSLLEELADLNSALPMTLEFEGRGKGGAGLSLRDESLRQRLARIALEGRLGIKGVHMRRPTVEKEVDDPFGLGCEVAQPPRQSAGRLGIGWRCHQPGQPHHSQAHA